MLNWNAIDACIQNKSLLKHDFYTAWSHGELTREDLRFYAEQYYALESTFPPRLTQMIDHCEDSATKKCLVENLKDEEGHPELWLRFAEGLGLSREEVINAPRHPMTQQCIDTLMSLAADKNLAVGLGALYAYESQLPAISDSKIDGLKRFYGIDDPRTTEFFEVHKTVDVWHAAQEKTAMEQMKASFETVYTAVEKSCAALWTFLDGVQAARLERMHA